MLSIRTFTWLAFALSVILYRSGGLIKNCILIRSPLPHGYIANGDYASDCTTLSEYADEAEAPNLSSCEDGTFWELHDVTGKVVERPLIITCDPERKGWNTVMGPMRNPDPHGTMWIYAPPRTVDTPGRILGSSAKPNKAYPLKLINYPANHDFHPLGVEIWPSHAGNSSNLYVINHARERTVVEQFVLDPSKPTQAVHIRTITSPYFLSPNGLALTSPDAFYVSNDHLVTRRIPIVGHVLPIIESVLGLPLGFVLHVTVNPPSSKETIAELTVAKPFIPFPNGVAVSPAGTEIAIVSTTLSEIHFFERDPGTNAIGRKKHTVYVPFSPDNVNYSLDDDGKEMVIVAGHPNFPDLTAVAANTTGASAGSWVVGIVPKEGTDSKPESKFDLEATVSTSTKISKDGANWTLKTLFQSDGVEDKGGFGGATTGLRDPDTDTVYVAGLYAKGGFLVCKPGSGIGRN